MILDLKVVPKMATVRVAISVAAINSVRFFRITIVPIKIVKMKIAAAKPKIPETEPVKSSARIRETVTKNGRRREFLPENKSRASERGIIITMNEASQLGWPRVEKMRMVGANSFCQQEAFRWPVKIRQFGS